jgi:hypothetical protein
MERFLFARRSDLAGGSFEVGGNALFVGHVSFVEMFALLQRRSQCGMPYRSVTFGPYIIFRVPRMSRVSVWHSYDG